MRKEDQKQDTGVCIERWGKSMSKGFRFQGVVLIAGQEFTAAITSINQNAMLSLYWRNTEGTFLMEMLKGLIGQSGGKFFPQMEVAAIPFDFTINRIGINYNVGSDKAFLFHTTVANARKEQLAVLDVFYGEKQGTGVIMQLMNPVLFGSIPILGKILGKEDGIRNLRLSVRKQKNKEMEWGLGLQYSLNGQQKDLILGDMYDNHVIYEAVSTSEEVQTTAAANKHAEESLSGEDVTDDSGIKWITLNKGLGAFTIKRIGGMAKEEGGEYKVFLYVDAGMSLSVVNIDLMGVNVGIPVSAITQFSLSSLKKLEFGMQGLGISYHNGPLSISGSFLRTKGERDRYDGGVIIKFNQFQFVGIGSYTTTEDGKASLFLYLMVGYPIGGVPAFFITGLAAGFGVNRGLKVPDVKNIKSFPLISMVMEKETNLDIDQALRKMGSYIYESKGEYFIAAGIEFTTFELLKTFALAIVTFGKEFRIQLLGLSTISLPPKSPQPFAYAELAIKAVFAPAHGILSIEAALTSASYLFCKDCRLTGGFAFYLWFSGEHKGDFVISLGGYHPRFVKPVHYPAVDRVGISWNIGKNLSMKGECYFAVTSTAVMAGGSLSFLYTLGNLKAWFSAYADLLISWAPFYYDIDVGISIGVSYTLKILFIRTTLKVELSARLHLMGPEFGGSVYIKWYIISFTIRFGSPSPKPVPLSYVEFKEKFVKDPLQMKVSEGLQGEYRDGEDKVCQVNVKNAVFRLGSKLPLTTIVMGSGAARQTILDLDKDKKNNAGVLPMGGGKRLHTVNTIRLYEKCKKDKKIYYTEIEDVSVIFKAATETENLPYALFGMEECSLLDVKFVKNMVIGVVMSITKNNSEGAETKFTNAYDVDELTKNEELPEKQCAPCLAASRIEDDFRLNLGQIMERMKRRRPREANMQIRKESRQQTLDYLNSLKLKVWRESELADAKLFEEPENHFMVQPVKRSVVKA